MTGSSLYDLLACPVCKTRIERFGDRLNCSTCGRTYPIVDDVPILFPDGHVPEFVDKQHLTVRTSYLPWIERLVMQSLPPGAVVLDLGAGNRACSLPQVIRMDVVRTPFVDVVGDAHAMPFLPGVFDFVFSLAVIEHLRNPFLAAQQMAEVLRPGGYVYGECNFIFPYHGYPNHFFNASQQGLEEAFAHFDRLRSGVAPYQMPSFAVRSLLSEYCQRLERFTSAPTARLRAMIDEICQEPLGTLDSCFPEEHAAQLAAGVFFFGVKTIDEASDVIPPPVQRAWRQSETLQQTFPRMLDLGRVQNVMLWAKSTGREQDHAIDAWFKEVTPFRKRGDLDDADLRAFEAAPVMEPSFGHIADPPAARDVLDRILERCMSAIRHVRHRRASGR